MDISLCPSCGNVISPSVVDGRLECNDCGWSGYDDDSDLDWD